MFVISALAFILKYIYQASAYMFKLFKNVLPISTTNFSVNANAIRIELRLKLLMYNLKC